MAAELIVRRERPAPRRTIAFSTSLIAVASAAGAAFAGCQPTGNRWADLVWTAVVGGLVAAAGAWASRPARLWMAGLAAIAAFPSMWLALPLLAFVAEVAGYRRKLPDWWGALAAGLSVQALLRLPAIGPFGTPTLIAVVVAVPVLVSAWRSLGRRSRRRWSVGIGIAMAIVVVVAGAAAVAALQAAPGLRDAAQQARQAVESAPDDSPQVTTAKLTSAQAGFRRASTAMNAWWVAPARGIPIVAQHLRAITVATRAGESLSDAAIEAAQRTETSAGLVSNGRVNLKLLADYRPVVSSAAVALRTAQRDVDRLAEGWLVGPVRTELQSLSDELNEAGPATETAADVLGVTDGLLGVGGVRRYLILATNPSETRELGGFVGGYVLVEANDGKITILESGKATDLNDRLAEAAPNLGDKSFKDRYGRYRIGEFFNNSTATPDFGLDAEIARAAFLAATGVDVDGVVVADPAAVAALLKLAGPVEVPAAGRTLDASTVEQYLLEGQYQQFEANNSGRSDVLVDVARAVTEAVFERPLPGPAKVVSALAPAVRDGHLMVITFNEKERSVLKRTGITGRFGVQGGRDFISLRGSNANANKIDVFLHREIRYEVKFDPATGRTSGTATVTLRNDAPTSGRPPTVIGGDSDPPGSNEMILAMHSRLGLVQMLLDGEQVGVETQREFGGYSSRLTLVIPPGGTRTLVYRFLGRLPAGLTYGLDVSSQPMVNADRYDVAVTDGAEWLPVEAVGLKVQGTSASGTVNASGTVKSQWRAPVSVLFDRR